MPTPVQRPASPQAGSTDHARAEWVAFLFRVPFALDAHRAGFTVGIREDYSYRQAQFRSLNLPVEMLDNDFRNPDRDRFREKVAQYRPKIAVLGDSDDPEEMRDLLGDARDLQAGYDDLRIVVVPKSRAALAAIPLDADVVVGYSNGYADRTADEFSNPEDWSSRDVHILGGSPPTQWTVIQRLAQTETTLADFGAGASQDPANVVGLDWNGLYNVAAKGEYWHRKSPHWRPADELSIRETIRQGLAHVRLFWEERGVWPAKPYSGTASVVRDPPEPDELVCACCGADLHFLDDVADLPTVEDADGRVYGFCSDRCRDRFGARAKVTPLDWGRPSRNERWRSNPI
jgi:hypothetical protein